MDYNQMRSAKTQFLSNKKKAASEETAFSMLFASNYLRIPSSLMIAR